MNVVNNVYNWNEKKAYGYGQEFIVKALLTCKDIWPTLGRNVA